MFIQKKTQTGKLEPDRAVFIIFTIANLKKYICISNVVYTLSTFLFKTKYQNFLQKLLF